MISAPPDFVSYTKMDNQTFCLITGCNRGIGRGLVGRYLSRPNTTVVAAVRNPQHPTSASLAGLPRAAGSSLLTVEMDCGDETSIAGAVRELAERKGVRRLDVVIANAAFLQSKLQPCHEVPLAELETSVRVNALGPLILFREVLPLLEAHHQQRALSCSSSSSPPPRFVVVSSKTGSTALAKTARHGAITNAAYGASKAMVNHLVQRIAYDKPHVAVWAQDPGAVMTDNLNHVVAQLEAPDLTGCISPEESASGMIAIIDGATAERTSGAFLDLAGEVIPY